MMPIDYRNLGRLVSPEDAGTRVDLFLGKNFLFLSRTEWSRRLDKQEVFVNSRPVKPSYRLRENDKICYFAPPSREPLVDGNIEVLWRKGGIIGVYKPPNLPMHEGGAYRNNTFYEVLRNKIGPEWAAVHRLDRETSGIVLCANDKSLRNSLSAELRERTMEKVYYAIVNGVPKQKSWIIDKPIGSAEDTSFRYKNWVNVAGAPAWTEFAVEDYCERFSLLKVFPKTGRTHQIRVHAAWAGLHLVGEKKYHPDESIYLEYLDQGFTARVATACHFERLCLHAFSIKFRNPTDGSTCKVEVPIPDDMKEIWNRLKNQYQ